MNRPRLSLGDARRLNARTKCTCAIFALIPSILFTAAALWWALFASGFYDRFDASLLLLWSAPLAGTGCVVGCSVVIVRSRQCR